MTFLTPAFLLGALAIAVALLRGLPGRLAGLAIGLVTFGLSVAVLTAVARADSGFAYSRYVTFSLLYWVGLLLLGGQAVTVCARPVRWALIASVFAGVLRFPVATQDEATGPFLDRADQTTAAALSMVVGAPDEEAIHSHLHPRPQGPLRLLPFLLERGYGFFGHPLVRAVGSEAADNYRIGVRACPATVDVVASRAGLRLVGHFDGETAPTWLFIVDNTGRIRGLAAKARRSSEIVGYAPIDTVPATLYGVQGDSLCLAASSRAWR